METKFWLERWAAGQTGFHMDVVHNDLHNFGDWLLGGGSHRVLVPLCGKSRDVHWIAAKGHRVAGVELSNKALVAMHTEQGIAYTTRSVGPFSMLESGSARLLTGDIFALQPDHLRQALGELPDRMWGRAALVALRPDQRLEYITNVRTLLAPGARVLLNVLNYDPAVMDGPPWSVPPSVVHELWSDCTVELLDRRDLSKLEPMWVKRGHEWFHRDLYGITLPG